MKKINYHLPFTIYHLLVTLSILALLVGLLTPLLNVQADTTGTLRPIADGTDDTADWLNPGSVKCNTAGIDCYLEVDEAGACDGDTSYISSKAVGASQTFDLSESSIPDDSIITAIAITSCYRIGTAGDSNTFQTRRCVNGSCNNSGTDISVTNATYAESTQTHSGLSITKTAATDIEIGVSLGSGAKTVRVSQISAVITYTPPDTTPPVITNIQASDITQTTAKTTWTTDEPATSQVEYGKTTSYGSETTLDPDLVTSHSVNLSGLEAGTLYHYRVKSKDAANNLAVSSDKTFTTEAGPDTTPPVISSIQATNISQTGATITWNTDEPSTSQVEYGTTTAYGSSTAFNSSLVTFHSVGLSGLAADTTYHYRVKSKDANNNLAVSGDKTFKTAGAPLPKEEVRKALPGTPKVEAPKIEEDKTPPSVSLNPPSPNPTKSPLTTFTGGAKEEKGIVSALQYSLNGGKSWHPIKKIKGLGAKEATLTFTTPYLVDGNYEVVVRAFDNSENIGLSPVRVLVVDVLPPLVGGHIAALGPQVLTPDEKGFVSAVVGSEQRIILSAVGGPTKVAVLSKEENFPLEFSTDTRLWAGKVRFSELGAHDLEVAAEDGAGNKTKRFLGSVLVQPGGEVLDGETGKPIEKAEVYLYFFEEVTKSWVLWNAEAFGLKNPYLTDKRGQYSFFVPPGKYYLAVRTPGYRTVTSPIVELERGSLLGYIFRLPSRPSITIPFFGITIELPSFLDFLVAGKEAISPAEIPPEPKTLKAGEKIPAFTLSDLAGGKVSSGDLKGKYLLTFGSVWSPTFSEQAPILSGLAKKKVAFWVVFLQEKPSAVETFLKRGGYSFPSLIDQIGALAQSYKVLTLPQHFFIKDGVIQAIKMGVLGEERLLEFFR